MRLRFQRMSCLPVLAVLMVSGVLGTASFSIAIAQSLEKPNGFVSVDSNGVELATGGFNLPALDLAIGNKGSGLAFQQTLKYDSYSGTAEELEDYSNMLVVVSFGERLFKFSRGTITSTYNTTTVPAANYHGEGQIVGTTDSANTNPSYAYAGIFANITVPCGQQFPAPEYQVVSVQERTEGGKKIYNCGVNKLEHNITYTILTATVSRNPYSAGVYKLMDYNGGNVATLQDNGGLGKYKLILASGETLTYNEGVLTSLKRIDGEEITVTYNRDASNNIVKYTNCTYRYYSYSYKNSSGQYLDPQCRFSPSKKTVSSNLGWGLKFRTNSDGTFYKAIAWNRAYEYCEQDANDCSAPQTSAYVDANGYRWVNKNGVNVLGFSSSQGFVTITSPLGKIVNIAKTVVNIAGTNYETGVYKVSKNGAQWGYTYKNTNDTVINGPYTVDLLAPDGISKSTAYYGAFGPARIVDELGRATNYMYSQLADSGSQLTAIVPPEGSTTKNSNNEYPGATQFEYDSRGNVQTIKVVPKTGTGAALTTTSSFAASCGNPLTCNKPAWVRDPKNNQTDFEYDPNDGRLLSETGPADVNGVRPKTRYYYTQLHPTLKDAAGTPYSGAAIWRVTRKEICAASVATCGGADDTVVEYQYNNSNLLLTAEKLRAGDSSLAITTTYEYDTFGNVISIDGPRTDIDDKSITTYDGLRRKLLEIGPDPDAGGPLKRPILKHFYDLDGLEYRTENGTCRDITYTGSVPSGCTEYAWTSAMVTTFDEAARPIRTDAVVP
ncbi:hypothetical protein MMA231_04011 (plasmid) [Asticcacaulis sp. MM231]|uniref:hypothetical protein n=1 Tax=Asticcacaulis sp. MM231 TaxID=3157666 RepID=UPI0032D5AC75